MCGFAEVCRGVLACVRLPVCELARVCVYVCGFTYIPHFQNFSFIEQLYVDATGSSEETTDAATTECELVRYYL